MPSTSRTAASGDADKCTAVYVGPQPSEDELARLYSGAYYRTRGGSVSGSKFASLKPAQQASWIHGHAQAAWQVGVTFVDIGCGAGALLESLVAQEHGLRPPHQLVCFEPNPGVAALARKRLARLAPAVLSQVYTQTFRSCNVSGGNVSLVTMSHVLEHVRDPHDAIAPSSSFRCRTSR
jgi:SAM-dependent methyltransferase